MREPRAVAWEEGKKKKRVEWVSTETALRLVQRAASLAPQEGRGHHVKLVCHGRSRNLENLPLRALFSCSSDQSPWSTLVFFDLPDLLLILLRSSTIKAVGEYVVPGVLHMEALRKED